MPPLPLCTRKAFIDALRPVSLFSTQGLCPICQEPFTAADRPVRLPTCGHTFCRTCILEWFRSGCSNSNTCPLDRATLFSLPPAPARSRRGSQQFVTLIQGGRMIAVNGMLTREGCRSLILDLWFYTWRLFRWMELDDLDGLGAGEDLLRRPIQDAIPGGVEVQREGLVCLVGIARQMMVGHSENWPVAEALGREELETWTGALERCCHGVDERGHPMY
ncbi:hypothetical protein K505DRAFT_249088 [Melanomma pulvis-pyrius CBS 109.77]|uniref:RING-type domain-containing protein n=1 Tax=Melanomma pulvis-pyrius CBS 109.77 TaxID=1314802 RepID=A0A6A6X627_9PLEO|nr:hypothetical protein K505DRAFT_249088 [Melanomma pulvis-pyrius CBS 109.77]